MYESALLVCEHNELEPFAVKSKEHEQSGVHFVSSHSALREGPSSAASAATGWPLEFGRFQVTQHSIASLECASKALLWHTGWRFHMLQNSPRRKFQLQTKRHCKAMCKRLPKHV